MGDGEEQDSRKRKWDRHPQKPGTGLAVFGFCPRDDEAHDDIGKTVKYTRDKHNCTDCHGRYADIIGVEENQQRADHAEYNVACYVTAAIGDTGQKWDASGSFGFFFHWSSLSAQRNLRPAVRKGAADSQLCCTTNLGDSIAGKCVHTQWCI